MGIARSMVCAHVASGLICSLIKASYEYSSRFGKMTVRTAVVEIRKYGRSTTPEASIVTPAAAPRLLQLLLLLLQVAA